MSPNWRSSAASPTTECACLAIVGLFKSYFPAGHSSEMSDQTFRCRSARFAEPAPICANSTLAYLHAIQHRGSWRTCCEYRHDCGHSDGQLAPAGCRCRLVFHSRCAENGQHRDARRAPIDSRNDWTGKWRHMRANVFAERFGWRLRVTRKAWAIAIVDRAVPGRAARSTHSRFGNRRRCGSRPAPNMSGCSRRPR
jgi:hypothetical protein